MRGFFCALKERIKLITPIPTFPRQGERRKRGGRRRGEEKEVEGAPSGEDKVEGYRRGERSKRGCWVEGKGGGRCGCGVRDREKRNVGEEKAASESKGQMGLKDREKRKRGEGTRWSEGKRKSVSEGQGKGKENGKREALQGKIYIRHVILVLF